MIIFILAVLIRVIFLRSNKVLVRVIFLRSNKVSWMLSESALTVKLIFSDLR